MAAPNQREPVMAHPPNSEKRPVSIDDLFRLRIADDPQLSSDGARVVLSVKTTDLEKNRYWSHLWVVPLDGGAARQFTFGEVSDGSARWSPDGRWLAFVRTREKKEQIWLMPADGGEPRQLTKLAEGHFGAPAWSPDGTQLLFTYRPVDPDWTKKAKERREKENRSDPPRVINRLWYRREGLGYLGDTRQHVWLCDVGTGEARRLTEGDYDHEAAAWSPDARQIAVLSNRSPEQEEEPYRVDVWLLPANGGDAERLPTPPGYKGGLCWSPDGAMLAYFGIESEADPWVPRNTQLWVVPVAGGAAQSLTVELDRTAENATLSDIRAAFSGSAPPVWSDDSTELTFLVSDSGSTHVYRSAVNGGRPVALTAGAGDVSAVHGVGERWVWLAASACRPPALWSALADGGGKNSGNLTSGARVLWDPNAALLEEIELSQPEEIRVEHDGVTLQGWLLHPPGFAAAAKHPLVLYVHGGPHAQYGNSFFHEFQFLAARGYVVLYANPRGSMGYAEEFATAIRGRWGDRDYRDVLVVLDEACRRPYVDSSRLAVAGGSYGGYMTNWLVGHTDRFRCAVTDRSVVDLVSMAGTCDFVFHADGYWEGNWWGRPESLWKQSPLKWIGDCKTPLLIIHSDGDLRCPISQAEQLYTALKRLKREVVFVRYPAETNHGMSRSGPPDLRRDRLERIVAWLDRFLK